MRPPARDPEGRSRSAFALEPAHGLVGQVELVAAASEHAQGALAGAVVGRRHADAVAQHLDGGLELVARAPVAERGRDVVGADPERPQPALDALGAPAVERAAVLGEAAGVAAVVEVALLAQL